MLLFCACLLLVTMWEVQTPAQMFQRGMYLKGGSIGTTRDQDDFVAHYGGTPLQLSACFEDLHQHNLIPEKSNPVHFLWATHLLKCYEEEFRHASFCKRHRENAKKWSWFFIRAIRKLKQFKIKWPNFDNNVATVFGTVDGVHCRTDEIGGYDPQYWSHKFNGAGLAYELVVSIHTQQLLSINGPFPATTDNLTIYRKSTKAKVPEERLLLGDRFYRGEDNVTIINTNDDDHIVYYKRRALSRHETFNQRLKKFRILRDPFRCKKHVLARHKDAFEACCVLTQYAIELDQPLFDI